MRKGLVFGLIILIGLVIAADRVGLMVAEKEIAKNVAAQSELDHNPKVSIKGFPFLTQALGGDYDEIDVHIGDMVQLGVHLKDAEVVLKGVHAPLSDAVHGDASKIVADSATSIATVGYDEVDKEAPNGMKVSAKGTALQVHGPVTVLGFTRTVTATVTVQPSGRSVRVVPQSVKTSGATIPMALVQQAFTFTVPVKGLPLGSKISDVTVQPDGLRVSATAQDVSLAKLNEYK
jgi:hypothetical protein